MSKAFEHKLPRINLKPRKKKENQSNLHNRGQEGKMLPKNNECSIDEGLNKGPRIKYKLVSASSSGVYYVDISCPGNV